MKKRLIVAIALMLIMVGGMANAAPILYDQNVTSNVIFGNGVSNGGWTINQNNGVELALRGKLRYNDNGQAENTWNSNGDGTYSFDPGVAPTQSGSNKAVWSLEWSINTNATGNSGFNLNDLTYVLGMDKDPSADTDFITIDPVRHNLGWLFAPDNAIGNNNTAIGDGETTILASTYKNLIKKNNVAQNSWQPSFPQMFGTNINNFDPNVEGTYTFFLEAYCQGNLLARTEIDIIVGAGAEPPIQDPIPEPATMTLLGLGMAGIAYRRLRKRA